jgi:hypothetical protein
MLLTRTLLGTLIAAQSTVPAVTSLPGSDKPDYVTRSVRGRVVWMSDALKRFHGVTLVPEAKEHLLALQTPEAELFPIVEDTRGRSLRVDERLREMDLELLVRQYEKTPMLQVIRIYQWDDGKKYLIDYWCDVCAITMFQSGPCDCCHDANQLRRRLVNERGDVRP